MKCEHCGKNEVTFVYRSNINGKVTEKHLCGECAEQLGYARSVADHSRRMMRSFDSFFPRSMLDDFFAPMPSLMGRVWEDPFEDFFAEMPALGTAPAEKTQEPKQEDLVSREEQERFSRMRQINALRHEMRKAVRKEEFERAAELRDQLHALEEQQKAG